MKTDPKHKKHLTDIECDGATGEVVIGRAGHQEFHLVPALELDPTGRLGGHALTAAAAIVQCLHGVDQPVEGLGGTEVGLTQVRRRGGDFVWMAQEEEGR